MAHSCSRAQVQHDTTRSGRSRCQEGGAGGGGRSTAPRSEPFAPTTQRGNTAGPRTGTTTCTHTSLHILFHQTSSHLCSLTRKRFSRYSFEEHVLNWSIAEVLAAAPGASLNPSIPSTFKSMEAYVEFLRPLILEEVLTLLRAEIMTPL
jgi:hypothetical protein